MTNSQHERLTETLLNRIAIGGLGATGLCLALMGCSGGSQSRIQAPGYNPSASAAQAMELYDKDGDGFIAGDELDKAPGIKAAIKNLDQDRDGKVSQQEIADRVDSWAKTGLGMMTLSCEVTLDGGLLDGAQVKFVPEPFLSNVILQAEGETSLVGTTNLRVPADKLPSPDMPPGIQLGLYQVQISKKQGDKELVPAKYNTETVLGQEVSRDDPAIMNNRVRFNLRSK